MDALVEFLRFLYTGRAGAMDPLTALDVLYLTNGEEGSGGKQSNNILMSPFAILPCAA